MKKCILIDDEKFYYNEVELYLGRKKIDREISKENLEIFYSIIERTPIKYGLIYGTLLGAIRENNFIEHDEDTDIYVLSEYKELLLKLLIELKKAGLELIRYNKGFLSIMRKNEYIDIYFLVPQKKFGLKRIRVMSNLYELDAKHFDVINRTLFLGMNIPIPMNPEELLVKIYGSNWKTPIENFNAQPNSFHARIFKKIPKLDQLPFYTILSKIYKRMLYR